MMSLRATGEGHISSIVFRSGMIDADGDVRLDAPGLQQDAQSDLPDQFTKSTFDAIWPPWELSTATSSRSWTGSAIDFTRDQLSEAIDAVRHDHETSGFLEETADTLISLTRVNYQLLLAQAARFREVEVVIFPFSDIERHGIEDLQAGAIHRR